jgi:hypothetical protein
MKDPAGLFFRKLFHQGQSPGASLFANLEDLRGRDAIGLALADAAVLLHHRIMVVSHVLLNDLDFFQREHGDHFHDLCRRAIALQHRNNVLDRDPGRRKLAVPGRDR